MILAFVFDVLLIAAAGICAGVWLGMKAYRLVWRWRMGLQHRRGYLVQPDFFYHPGHTWIAREGAGAVRVGLDDFGRRLVDGIYAVGLPAVGSRLRQGKGAVALDCGEERSAVLLSPVEGVVTSVNDSLTRNGSALERDPYGKGWLFTAQVADEDFTRLPTGDAALAWLEKEVGRLATFLHPELGATAADGGELIPKPSRALEEGDWDSLVRAFFGTPGADGPA